MLEEKLRQASEANAKNSKRILLIFAIAAVVFITFILVISFVDFSAPSPAPETAISVKAISQEESSQLRKQFMDKLHVYKDEIEPALIDANIKAWDAKKEFVIASLKDKAVASFATGDYAGALKELSDSEIMARQILAQAKDLFASRFSMAESALAADNYNEAKLHITKALLVKPNDPKAHELDKQINTLPQIIALLKKAAIARTENNPEKEYAAVAEAFNIAPHRQSLKQRKEMLAETIKERQFAPLIALGLANVEKRKLRAARANYQKAKSLYPARSELHVLNEAIGKLAAVLNLGHVIAQGKTAIAQDDWVKARSVYAAGATRHPDNKTILDGLQLSSKLVNLHQVLSDYISRSERLSSQNISADAQNAIIQARVFTRNSPSLSRKAATLDALLAQANVKIPVTVKSDNQTYILVRGVGKVGTTQERIIQLKPGAYTFEGLREGYKSKLVEVRIPVGTSSFGVEVVCDERI